jgi:hypothetical protein
MTPHYRPPALVVGDSVDDTTWTILTRLERYHLLQPGDSPTVHALPSQLGPALSLPLEPAEVRTLDVMLLAVGS